MSEQRNWFCSVEFLYWLTFYIKSFFMLLDATDASANAEQENKN
jgi:hypothetical protein